MYPTGRGNWICIDRCLLDEILGLWRKGIWTLECCCGHNKVDGYIIVANEHITKMEKIGYKRQYHPTEEYRNDIFYPKIFQIKEEQ